MKFEYIEVLRFPLMVLVVFVHLLPFEIQQIRLSADADAMFILVSELISHHLGRIAVPCFFLFSGNFFFLKINTFNGAVYTAQLRSRIRTLLVPYLLWNSLFVLAMWLKNMLFIKAGMPADELYSFIRSFSLYNIYWSGPVLFPLWFLRDLICMTLLSPLFYLLFRTCKIMGLVLLLLTYLSVLELPVPGLSSTAFMFYGAGAFLGLKRNDIAALTAKLKFWPVYLALILLAIAAYYGGKPAYEYWVRPFILVAVLAVLGLAHRISKTSYLKSCLLKVGPSVFFIYAVHGLYIINWIKGAFANSAFFNAGWGKLAAYFVSPVLCLIVCLLLYSVMKRLLPKMLTLLTGGRTIVKKLKISAHDR